MAKLAVHLAIFALLLFLANASIHTTITVDDEDENPWGSPEGSCQQQIMQQNYLKHCQKYMKEQFSDNLGSEHLDSCCKQLQRLDRRCRCPGLKQALQQPMEGRMGRGEMQEQQMAEKIMPNVTWSLGGVTLTCHLAVQSPLTARKTPGGHKNADSR